MPCRQFQATFLMGMLWKQQVMDGVDWYELEKKSPQAADKQLCDV